MIRIIESVTPTAHPVELGGLTVSFHYLGQASGWIASARVRRSALPVGVGEGRCPDSALADLRVRLARLRDELVRALDATADEATAGDLARSA